MTKLVQNLTVPFDFPVYFTRDVFAAHSSLLADAICRLESQRQHRVMVCLDRGVCSADPTLPSRIRRYFKAHHPRLSLAGPLMTLAGGEGAKTNWRTLMKVIRQINARSMDRQSVIVVIGGGSILDMVGLAASLVHRGVRLLRLPTTVTAQDDVGVGVKTGMDLFGTKNFIGTFAPPFAVINDFDFLDRLPDREWISGIAEAFKVALIKDAAFLDFLCAQAEKLRQRDPAAMEHLVERCATLHLHHIREGHDPFEMGSARPLDFGHWSAHQLELLSLHALRHGEAVAIGIALDSYYAMRIGLMTSAELERVLAGLERCGLPLWHELLGARNEEGDLAILQGLTRFQEHLGGELTITLPASIGNRTEIHAMDPSILEEGITWLNHRQQASRTGSLP